MTKKSILHKIFIAFVFTALTVGATFAQTTVFTYQGKLTDNGTPQAVYEMQFRLFGSAGGADQIGATITNPNVSVNSGVFTVNLDFGASAFPGADRYLEISVRRNSTESFITLNPRQQIASSPYSIRTLSAAQADVALDANKLGGVPASDYVTTSSVGNSFIKNGTTQQTANFNINGNGTVGGTLQGNQVTAQTGANSYGVMQTDGTTSISTFVGVSSSGATGGWLGTRSNSPLYFFTNGGQPRMTILTNGNTGIGTATPTSKLEIAAQDGLAITGFQPFMTFRDTNNANLQARITGNDGGFFFSTNNSIGGTPTMAIRNSGNVGIGTTGPPTRLQIIGGPAWTSAQWTGSLSLGNASAIGWEANASGQRFGIGQTNGGLVFFRTTSAFGNTASPANYDLAIQDDGNLTQARDKAGVVKAMIYVDPFLPPSQYIVRCYNGITNSSTGNCGFTVTRTGVGDYRINFGFKVDDRFLSATGANEYIVAGFSSTLLGTNTAYVAANGRVSDSAFYLIIY